MFIYRACSFTETSTGNDYTLLKPLKGVSSVGAIQTFERTFVGAVASQVADGHVAVLHVGAYRVQNLFFPDPEQELARLTGIFTA